MAIALHMVVYVGLFVFALLYDMADLYQLCIFGLVVVCGVHASFQYPHSKCTNPQGLAIAPIGVRWSLLCHAPIGSLLFAISARLDGHTPGIVIENVSAVLPESVLEYFKVPYSSVDNVTCSTRISARMLAQHDNLCLLHTTQLVFDVHYTCALAALLYTYIAVGDLFAAFWKVQGN